MKRLNLTLSILFTFLICSDVIFSLESDAESRARLEIVSRLQKWPEDFNAKNIQEVCGLFAPDLIASYPGTADRNYDEMCRQLTGILSNPDKIFRYEVPKIEQILIDHDLAVVRLIWTLIVSNKYISDTELIKYSVLDVF